MANNDDVNNSASADPGATRKIKRRFLFAAAIAAALAVGGIVIRGSGDVYDADAGEGAETGDQLRHGGAPMARIKACGQAKG